jgi:hypothetical protein
VIKSSITFKDASGFAKMYFFNTFPVAGKFIARSRYRRMSKKRATDEAERLVTMHIRLSLEMRGNAAAAMQRIVRIPMNHRIPSPRSIFSYMICSCFYCVFFVQRREAISYIKNICFL